MTTEELHQQLHEQIRRMEKLIQQGMENGIVLAVHTEIIALAGDRSHMAVLSAPLGDWQHPDTVMAIGNAITSGENLLQRFPRPLRTLLIYNAGNLLVSYNALQNQRESSAVNFYPITRS